MALEERIDRAISVEIQREITEKVDKIIAEAQQKVEHEIRKVVARAALSVSNYYELERAGPSLVIRVKIGDGP